MASRTPILRCEAYLNFIAEHPLRSILLKDQVLWHFFDLGPKKRSDGAPVEPLICIHGSSGTCHAFFLQLSELSKKGFRVISVGIPNVFSHEDWAKSFDRFLDELGIRGKVHLYGTSLGGFLAQVFCKLFPKRVASLALTNSLCDTSVFHENATLTPAAYAYMPDFFLRNLILESFPKDETYPPGIGEAIEFQITQLETLSRQELASRITLNVSVGSSPFIRRPGCLELEDSKITLIDSLDKVSIHQSLRNQLYNAHPEAKQAFLKTGGDFPYLSRYEEVNMHLIVHLRRNGLKEQPVE